MAKTITNYVCQECGYDSSQFMGKCPECGQWNSMKEFKVQKSKAGVAVSAGMLVENQSMTPRTLSSITASVKQRVVTGFVELDTVLGGGLVNGSAILLAGDPGIGKSTLLLQVGMHMAGAGSEFRVQSSEKKNEKSTTNSEPRTMNKVLYISGEESEDQIKLRAERVLGESGKGKGESDNNLLILSTSDTDAIAQVIATVKPSLVIIDSIQTMQTSQIDSFAGSVGQIRYAAASFIKLAKSLGIPTIMVGHVTKEGMVAGPMLLSHMVDTVLFFEGEKLTKTRILRSLKNRFGPVDEVGVFSMEGEGISEVKNPEQIFLTKQAENTPGSVLTVMQEGSRSFLIELQALVVYSKFPMPRRVASGVDSRRLELLLAVLQKHARLPFETQDVFVNVAGGLKVQDPAVDLAICLALFSSLKNVPLSQVVAMGEVGLQGEIRGISNLEKRVKEAKSLGLKTIITP
ncbi:MAG: DNA repair protein RadA, partial [Candidatus Levybacteria bacterium]|nr:DNA repair protein RadA [Candidatus Levybacteria bacterium]